jgi:hypothetical protein
MISDISRLDKIFRTYIFFKSNSIKNEEIREIVRNNCSNTFKKDLRSPNGWILMYYSDKEDVEYVKNIVDSPKTVIYVALALSEVGNIKNISFDEY